MEPKIPDSLKARHEEVHAELAARASKVRGKVRDTAKVVRDALHSRHEALHSHLEHAHQGHAHQENRGDQAVEFEIPRSLKVEHEELHAELVEATRAPGKTGEAARAVARFLHPHFEKEEEYALPPLGLLQALARDEVTPEMAEVLPLADKLKAELDQMLEEHKGIVLALENLIDAAKQENAPKHVRFAEKLMLHARTEEEVSYPTAILVGEYVRLRLK